MFSESWTILCIPTYDENGYLRELINIFKEYPLCLSRPRLDFLFPFVCTHTKGAKGKGAKGKGAKGKGAKGREAK